MKSNRIPFKPLAIGFTGAVLLVIFGVGLNNRVLQSECGRDPLRDVYNPSRLTVIQKCAKIVGTVIAFRKEEDDFHVAMRMDKEGWFNEANIRGNHGYTMVEFIPSSPRPQRIFAGQRLKLTVTKVYDEHHRRGNEPHGWIEGHPVFFVEDITPEGVKASPNDPELVGPSAPKE